MKVIVKKFYLMAVVFSFLVGCGESAKDFRLVKLADNPVVWQVSEGKKSAITEWAWVVQNADGKAIETITETELKSYPDTGVKLSVQSAK